MTEKRYLVAVDCGTTSSRTVVFDFKGNLIALGQAANPLTYPGVGRVECEGPAMVETLHETTRMALARAQIDPREVAGVSFDVFRCTIATRDPEGGFTAPIIIWQDLRAVDQLGLMEARLQAAGWSLSKLYDSTGMPLGPTQASAKLQWIMAHDPQAYHRASRIHTMMGLMTKAYGADDYYDDTTNTPWLQLNDKTLAYSPALCQVFGVDPDKLAPLRQPGEIIGQVTAEVEARTGLAAGTPLVMGTGDHQSGGLGSGCIDQRMAYACGGAAGIAAGRSFSLLRDPQRKCHVLGTPDGAYVMEAQSNTAGSALKWCKAEIDDGADGDSNAFEVYDSLTLAASRSAPGANGCFFLPYLQGANTPHYDAKARATYVGMTFAHSRADLVRATLEGICFEFRDLFDALVASHVPQFDTVRLTGGISRSDFWCQMQADIYNRPCETVACDRAPALGAAIVAAVGVGVYSDFSRGAANMVHVSGHYEPDPAQVERYQDAYRAWQEIYQAMHGRTFETVVAFQEKYR
ncbi:MAG: hypothetical protein LBJ44_06815 [Propionibacteriaceae bacterium]|nr:hypothetical protein [Propionibacteriaceae bacterium]